MLSLCHVAFTLDAADYRNPSATADGGAVLFRAWDACLSSSEANAAAVLFNYANALTRWEQDVADYERDSDELFPDSHMRAVLVRTEGACGNTCS